MDRICSLPDELLVKILSSVPTKVAVSTSALSKRWGRLWMWAPNLDCYCYKSAHWDFIVKNLPLRAPIIESLCLEFNYKSFEPEDFKVWVGIAVSGCLRELSINYRSCSSRDEPDVLFPRSLYTCISLVTLKLRGDILIDVPEKVCLPSLKTLQLELVVYLNQDCLRLLLSCCPVMEDLVLELSKGDNVKALVVIVPSLQRLSLIIEDDLSDGSLVVTPSLKYLKIGNHSDFPFSSVEYMPELEEADIDVLSEYEELLKPITNVKRLSFQVLFNIPDVPKYRADIVFSRLEELKVCICSDNWSNLVVYFLRSSPKLRVLKLYVDPFPRFGEYKRVDWTTERISAPQCMLRSLETFEFAGYKGRREERYFLSFLFMKARCLKSVSFTPTDYVVEEC